MNANHARPLAAFWLLAIVAAGITGTGLRASQSPAPGAVATPATVSTRPAPELVLGGVLRARTSQALLHPLAPGLWAPGSAGEQESVGVQVASPGSPGTTYKARTGGGAVQPGTKVQAHASGTSTAQATATATTTATGHGKGRGKDEHTGGPTTTATPTGTPTGPGQGAGQGASAGHGH